MIVRIMRIYFSFRFIKRKLFLLVIIRNSKNLLPNFCFYVYQIQNSFRSTAAYSIDFTVATTFSVVNPNFGNSSEKGADAPNPFIVTYAPSSPTYLPHP